MRKTQAMIAILSEGSRKKVAAARHEKAASPSALFIGARAPDGEGGASACAPEARFDGLAGCLRTPGRRLQPSVPALDRGTRDTLAADVGARSGAP